MVPKRHVVAVLLESPEGIPLVRDPSKPAPVCWKLPGGKSEDGETPIQTAWREVGEETGIYPRIETLQMFHQHDKKLICSMAFEHIFNRSMS